MPLEAGNSILTRLPGPIFQRGRAGGGTAPEEGSFPRPASSWLCRAAGSKSPTATTKSAAARSRPYTRPDVVLELYRCEGLLVPSGEARRDGP